MWGGYKKQMMKSAVDIEADAKTLRVGSKNSIF